MAKDEGFGLGGAQTVLLALLRERARHAYDIAREVKLVSDNKLPFHYGTLYPTLYRMERDGLIVSVVEQPEGERMRRVYCLTEKGIAEADRVKQAWNDYAEAMDRIVNRGDQAAEGS